MLEEHGSWEMISCLQEEDDSYIFKRLCFKQMFSLTLNLTTAPQVVEGENNIFVPKNGEWVDATTERFIHLFALTYLHSHPCSHSHPCPGAAERFLILHSEVQQSEGCSGESILTLLGFLAGWWNIKVSSIVIVPISILKCFTCSLPGWTV